MFKSKKIKKEIRKIEEDLRSVVIQPKKSEIKLDKPKEKIKSKCEKMELKEIKPPYPKCPSCDTYLEDNEIYNKKGKRKHIDWTKGHKVKWVCNNCGAEYESEKEEEDEQLFLPFTKSKEHKIIHPKEKRKKKKR